MDSVPLSALIAALVLTLACSAFSSIAETCMMAANRYRLRSQAANGDLRAARVLGLLAQSERLLSTILLINVLLNSAASTLTAIIAIRFFGQGESALAISTALASFLILIFAEISPKVIGAKYPDALAPWIAMILSPLIKLASPVLWFTDFFVRGLFKVLRLDMSTPTEATMTREELRTLVLEGQHLLPPKHSALLVNFFELDALTVRDVMVPRRDMETLNLQASMSQLREQLATAHHTRIPVHEDNPDRLTGVIHLRQAVSVLTDPQSEVQDLRALVRPPYYLPESTGVLEQLQQFQSRRERLGFVVDEYGDVQGIVTIEDLIEEVVGEFTSHSQDAASSIQTDPDGRGVLVDGRISVRRLNRQLGLKLPTEKARTLNGLLLDELGDIPEAGVSLRLADITIEVVHVEERAVRTVRLVNVGNGAALRA